jgi:GT2 family glycosyltransferase
MNSLSSVTNTGHNVTVSVVICAYTELRWHDLTRAVNSLHQQTHPPNEIIVVIDHNPSMLERVRTEISGVLTIPSTELKGASGAKNSGIAKAKSEWIAFLDDDAEAEPHWLESLLTTCLTHTDAMGVGGWVVPKWAASQPKWLPEEFYWVIGASYRGLPTTIAPVRNLFAGCMCLHRSVFEQVGGFRTEIGPLGKRPINCEETELCIRAAQKLPKRQFYLNPAARIHHNTPNERTTWAYFKKRCYSEGLAKALVTRFVGANAALSAERNHVLKTLPMGIVNGLGDAIRGDIYGFVRAMMIVIGLGVTTAGYISGILAHHRDRAYKARKNAQIV